MDIIHLINHQITERNRMKTINASLFTNRTEDFQIKLLTSENEKYLAFQLRKEIFCDKLNWVNCIDGHIEVDNYDDDAILIGALDEFGDIIGTVRVIPAFLPMMIEKEFSLLISPGHRIRKEVDTAEASRLCVRSTIDSRKKSRISHALYHAAYKWCMFYGIRYLYIVVEKKMLRNLNRIGLSCHSVGPMVIMPDGTHAIAAIIDWSEFERTTHFGRDGLLHKVITSKNTHVNLKILTAT